ncbi:hypothetical protein [Palleronia sp. LCG004]|uniref:hypothetical protein n=1 Tax=Palleronia sp. LCG004 TaxID=3079304 RepID=UPI002943363F|nr:hypothetical protein [Palleronia sp. LCG004]WOI56294.1 hypothetical protein RVY76_00425 [Palleronia sp. LCG004]
MRQFATSLVVAAGLAASGGGAHAATLGYQLDAPFLMASGSAGYFAGGDLSFFGTSASGIDVTATFALMPEADQEIGFIAFPDFLEIDDFGFEVGEGTDRLELLFDDGGALSLAVLTGEFGSGESFASSDFFTAAEIEISRVSAPAVIPLPAGGVLLLSGLALLRLRRRIAG